MSNTTITSPKGFQAAAVRAGIKASGNLDLGLIVTEKPCNIAAMFTTNKVVAPAIVVSREHIQSGRARVVFVNAGNANTCTGARGLRDVHSICRQISRRLQIEPSDILVCSTGIIGKYLPMDKVRIGIDKAIDSLSVSAKVGLDLARAIMTTDTKAKLAHQQIKIGSKVVHLAGIAKGSGMIAPNMATMLAFITTDADITSARLQRALLNAVEQTFNKVTIDNHMSTSDSAIVMASGGAGNKRISKSGPDYERFAQALWYVCDDLAQQMAADGEGATCAVTVRIKGARTQHEAHLALRAIADSPLVRCAFNGADPNWGRIVSAVGYSGARFSENKLSCKIAGTTVFRTGRPCKFNVGLLSRRMKTKKWQVEVDLGLGRFSDFCYTCDLSDGYVKINADYHT